MLNSRAVQDGRLRKNDRLIRLNGVSLIGRSNSQTMATLREALQRRGSVASHIDLVVARQTPLQPALTHCCSSEALSDPPPSPSLDPPTKAVPHAANKGALRNVSYHMANADSFVGDGGAGLSTPRTVVAPSQQKAPTINGGHVDIVLIETDASHSSTVSSRSLLVQLLAHILRVKWFFMSSFYSLLNGSTQSYKTPEKHIRNSSNTGCVFA